MRGWTSATRPCCQMMVCQTMIFSATTLLTQSGCKRNLADIVVEDSSDCALISVLLADDVVGMDICEVCDAVALPDSLARPTCACQQKCVERVMEVAEPTVRHLRDEVRDKSFLLELVKHAHLATVSPQVAVGAAACGRLQDTMSAKMGSRCSWAYPRTALLRS